MNDYKTYIIGLLDQYKCKSTYNEWRILPIYNEKKNLLGFLKPVTIFYKEVNPRYIQLLYKWRGENQEGFRDEFENNIKKTENWFDDILLPREDRLLFFVHSLDDKPIGHIGVSTFDFDKMSCEIDNVVRGVKNEYRGIMSYATKTVIGWNRNILKVNDIYLRVFSENQHEIQFYERNNFVKQYNIPVQGRKAELYYTYMKWKE